MSLMQQYLAAMATGEKEETSPSKPPATRGGEPSTLKPSSTVDSATQMSQHECQTEYDYQLAETLGIMVEDNEPTPRQLDDAHRHVRARVGHVGPALDHSRTAPPRLISPGADGALSPKR
jgi:hypothetical protein